MSGSLSLTIVFEEDATQLVLEPTETIENLKALLDVQLDVRVDDQVLVFNGRELQNSQTLQQAGIKDQDLIILLRRRSINQNQPMSQSEKRKEIGRNLLNYVKANRYVLNQIHQTSPSLAKAIETENLEEIGLIIEKQELEKKQKELEQLKEMEKWNSDPFNPEYQKKIAEAIKQKNIEENWTNAMEYNPETFARVVMLYVDCSVNGVPVKAFVDSGAQQTIMSAACAERCGIGRLIDHRYEGIAKGVGTAKIIGRVHLAQIKLGNSHFPCSFTILQDQSVEFLLGLDMLRRHQCIINLEKNVLEIGNEKVPFLAEKDIPKSELFDDQTPPSTPIHQPTPLQNDNSKELKMSQPLSSQSTTTTTPQFSFSEASVSQLMALGFSRQQVLEALKVCNGNPDLAASYLFGAM